MHEITSFLRGFPPFDDATEAALGDVEAATEIEFFPAGAFVLRAGEDASPHAYVLRTGHVELLEGGRVVDVLGPGDVVGLPSLLTDLPPGLDARAAEDLLVYRIPGDSLLPLLAGRSGLRFVAETVRDRTPSRRATDRMAEPTSPTLTEITRQAVTVPPDARIRDVVRSMHERDASSAVAAFPDGSVAIMTDHDLRNRVLAVGRSLDEPVRSVMTHPAQTVPPETTVDDAILVMLVRGVRHLPVVDAGGVLVGVVEEVDLLAAQERTPSRLRRAIARAADVDELVAVCRAMLPGIIEAHHVGQGPERVTASFSVLVESVIARIIALRLAERGNPPVPFVWLITGSAARREMVPSSDLDSALAWDGPDDDEHVRRWMRRFAADVLMVAARCGIEHDTNGVRADDPRFSRSAGAWCDALDRWALDPTADQADIYLTALIDAVPIWGDEVWTSVRHRLTETVRTPLVRRMLTRLAEAHRPPTGFARDLVIEATGEHRGTVDLKLGGVAPLVELGRLVAALSGSPQVATLRRLEDGHASGLLSTRDADDLTSALLLLTTVRLDHQCAQLADGHAPDDHLEPQELANLTRRHLRDALRVIARAQRQLTGGTAGRSR